MLFCMDIKCFSVVTTVVVILSSTGKKFGLNEILYTLKVSKTESGKQ